MAHAESNKMSTGPFPGVKWLGRGVDYPPLSSVEFKERVGYTFILPLGLCGLLQGEIRFLTLMMNLETNKTSRKILDIKSMIH